MQQWSLVYGTARFVALPLTPGTRIGRWTMALKNASALPKASGMLGVFQEEFGNY
jgi:hypothetical protein